MERSNKRILFFGTDDVSASALNALLSVKANVVGIVSKPDRPSGRHKKIIFSPIKQIALANNIPLFQPEKLSLMVDEVLATKPDLILTCSYGKLIPKEILDYPEYKCLNIHPSLLPKYRGAAPIEYAVLNGEKTTGVTLYIMTPELDAGPIVSQINLSIDPNERRKSLWEKVKKCIYEFITSTIFQIFEKPVNPIPQDESKATFVKIISREDEKIDWNAKAEFIDRKIRALYDKPIAHTSINGIDVKIHSAEIDKNTPTDKYQCGQIIDITSSGIKVATQDFAILIKKIHLPGKKPTLVSQIINGNIPFKVSDIFA